MINNNNNGYSGYSRSVRSLEAMSSYEVPIAQINKSIILDFLKDNDYFKKEDLDVLLKISVAKWKYIAKERVLKSSWHHTSKFYNETNHYSLYTIAEKILEIQDTLDLDYKEYCEQKTKRKTNLKYGLIKVQVWSGSKKHPKIIDYDEVSGIVKDDWLYFKKFGVNSQTKKYKISANKVESFKTYDKYSDLVKENKTLTGTKKILNKIEQEL